MLRYTRAIIKNDLRDIMTIQEITLSNNQKKKLQKAVNGSTVLFQDDNGDLVVNVEAYLEFLEGIKQAPIEDIVGNNVLNYDAEYFVFS